MNAIALRLESFGTRAADPEPSPTDTLAERAYQDGYERGLNHGREASLDALCAELARLGQHRDGRDAEAARIRRDTMADLRPVLTGLVALLGRASATDRLMVAVEAQLTKLAGTDPETSLQIRCPPDMAEDIRDCLARSGLRNASIVDGAGDEPLVELRSGAGRTCLDPARMLDELGAVIADIFQEE